MPQLRAILFDLDDTLCATTEFAQRARRNAVRAMIAAGLEHDEEEVLAELGEVISEFSSNYEHHFDKLLLRLDPDSARDGKAPLNRALVVAAGVAAYHDTKFREWRPFPGVHELFSELKQAGVRLGIITHGLAVKQAEKLIRLGLTQYLDPQAIFISDQIGISKPNPKLYQTALRELGLEPGEAMYVGDNPANDIAPPKSLGMITVWARAAAKSPLGDEQPDHVIESFEDLRRLLSETYRLSISPESADD
jgi:putative hydrolase of the HAD superfamily